MAVLGCGGIARQYHLPILRSDPRAKLLAAADPDPASLRRAGDIPGLDLFADPVELLDRVRPRAAVVCAATPAHAELARAVLERGIHLYLEKPIALEEREGEELVAAAASAGVVGQTGFNYRFHPGLIELRRLLATGAVGEPLRARATFVEKLGAEAPEWKRRRRSGGGALLDLGSHDLDLARWLFGAEIAELGRARIDSRRFEHAAAALSVGLSNGVGIDLELGYGPRAVHRWEIEGSDGALRFDQWPARISRGTRHPPGWAVRRRTLELLSLPRREPSFAPALGAFLGAVAGELVPLPSLAEGLESLRAVRAAERAAGEGGRVSR